MVSCKISLPSQTSVTATASEVAVDSSLHQKKLKLSGYNQNFTFNLIIRIETVTNCGEEPGSRTECFCWHWGNSVLSLRQLKGYSKNQSWCSAQVSYPIYLVWTLFLQHCSMFSRYIREVSFTRPQAAHLSSNSLQSQEYTTGQIKSNQIPFMKFPPLGPFSRLNRKS